MSPIKLPIVVHLLYLRTVQESCQVLLLKRSWQVIFPGYWCMPTGKMEQGETPLQAMQREASEEIGIIPDELRVMGISFFQDEEMKHKTELWQHLSLFFVGDYNQQEVINKEPEKHECFAWFALNDLPALLTPAASCGLKQYLENDSYSEYLRTVSAQ